MPVDPEIQPFLDLVNTPGMPALGDLSPEETRTLMASMSLPRDEADGLAWVDDDVVAGVPVRWYRPAGAAGDAVLVWIHGGGWVIGSVTTADYTASKLAVTSGVTVCSVEYRLAPEHPFPAAADDCFAVVGALGGVHRLAVGGDSAGGNLATVACLLARDAGGPGIALQALVYPVTDLSMGQASYVENAEGYFLTADSMRWFVDQYVPDAADRKDWRCAPLQAPSLEGLPPAVVITAGLDPLRDEGEAYVERLRASGVVVDHVRVEDAIHGFFGFPDVAVSVQARERVARAVAAALA